MARLDAQTTLADALDRPDLTPAPLETDLGPDSTPGADVAPPLFNAPRTIRGQLNLEGT
jgi:hypothetical protein